MASPSLAHYDGLAGTLVDTNVWVDCIDATSPWHAWSVNQLEACSGRAPLHINLVIYTELLVPRPSITALDVLLDVYEAQRSVMPWTCAALAARAFGAYRQGGGLKRAPLPDFYIGAHAAVSNLSVLTRDPKPYTGYFPRLAVVAP